MDINILQTMALLKTNWDKPERKDYMELFVPIVIQCIRLLEHEEVSSPSVQKQLTKHFGLSVPSNIVENILKRIQKRELLSAKNKILYRDNDAILYYENKNQFVTKRDGVVREYENLIRELSKFAKEHYQLTWNDTYTERCLFEYLDINGITIISSLTSGVPLKQVLRKGKEVKKDLFVVANFILETEKNRRDIFQYFDSIVQGNILASSIYLPDVGRVQKNSLTPNSTLILRLLYFLWVMQEKLSSKHARSCYYCWKVTMVGYIVLSTH
uniref:Uncharacterized protein n=1 Tax=Candidatus Kentrum sp. TUN TaxID=2126343 RepID=A0A450ZTS2_9GAMM|nr:MAG: hypothetical protein BECKTUN1418D_GA0071000_10602 [Candidatus Kentron sp. TUN]